MARTPVKKKQQELAAQERALQIAQDNVNQIELAYKQELETNPDFSLVVDPLNKYNLPVKTKEFVRHYIEHRNIATAAVFCHIEMMKHLRFLHHSQFNKRLDASLVHCIIVSSLKR